VRVVVSNRIQRLTEAVVRGLGVADRFDLILGCDSAAEKKPHPAFVQHLRSAFTR
jgi:phosphoglycolate phosphatase-like HAD superfamily hydrolase